MDFSTSDENPAKPNGKGGFFFRCGLFPPRYRMLVAEVFRSEPLSRFSFSLENFKPYYVYVWVRVCVCVGLQMMMFEAFNGEKYKT